MATPQPTGLPVLTQTIVCHAFNADRTQVAVVPNTNEIHIYKIVGNDVDKWERLFILAGHDKLVTCLDWAPKTNRILSCSQDRNAYVWNYEKSTDEWKPELVLLRINRAATCCKWSPDENKFAVGSGAKTVCVCYYEQENLWWVARMIKKPHKSTILNVDWDPSNPTILATACSDFKCRTFSAFVKEVDKKDQKKANFGEVLTESAARGWVHDVAFSPNGNFMAYVSHDSSVTIVDRRVAPNAQLEQPEFVVRTHDLPYKSLKFVSNNALVAAGFDMTPVVIYNPNAAELTAWQYLGQVDTGDAKAKAGTVTAGAASAARAMFQQTSAMGAANVEKGSEIKTKHQNNISGVQIFKSEGTTGFATVFSTAGLDGRVFLWPMDEVKKKFTTLTLA